MAGEQWKEGDVVVLKFCGPVMTVEKFGQDEAVTPTMWCAWFDGNKEISAACPAAAVEGYEELTFR